MSIAIAHEVQRSDFSIDMFPCYHISPSSSYKQGADCSASSMTSDVSMIIYFFCLPQQNMSNYLELSEKYGHSLTVWLALSCCCCCRCISKLIPIHHVQSIEARPSPVKEQIPTPWVTESPSKTTIDPASYSTNQQPPGFEVGEQKLSKDLPKPSQPSNGSFTAQAPSSGMQVLFKWFTDITHKLIYSFHLETLLNWKPHLSLLSSRSASTKDHHDESGLLLLGCRANFFASYRDFVYWFYSSELREPA